MQKTGNELTYDYDFYALNGLLSFLRLIQEEGGKKVWCQRPNRASFISTFLKIWVNMDLKCVNALNGLLSFLRTSTNGNCTFHIMCQRPKRASFISTVPSGTPRKHWLSSSIFAGICLNFLIITVFREFFGMFTLCSYFPHIIILSHAA